MTKGESAAFAWGVICAVVALEIVCPFLSRIVL